jgi:hypothetical protein
MKVLPLDLAPVATLISTYEEGKLVSGLLLEPTLTTGTLNRLIKIRSKFLAANEDYETARLAIGDRNGIKAGDVLDENNEDHKQFFIEFQELISTPVDIDFTSVSPDFIDNIVISESKIIDGFKDNLEALYVLLEIIKGEYEYVAPVKEAVLTPEITE